MPWVLAANVVRNPTQMVKLFDMTVANQYFAIQLPDYGQDEVLLYGTVLWRSRSTFSNLLPTTVFQIAEWQQWSSFRVYQSIQGAQATSEVWFRVPEKGKTSLRIKGYRLD